MGISRIDQPDRNNFGYYVRVTRHGEQYAKFFADRQNGGKRRALRAAREHLNTLLESMPVERRTGLKTIRNTSGRVGVSRTKSTSRGHTYSYWQASWTSGDARRSVKFAINKYGEEKAKRLAVKARRTWEREADESS